jgi:hypothetical protein
LEQCQGTDSCRTSAGTTKEEYICGSVEKKHALHEIQRQNEQESEDASLALLSFSGNNPIVKAILLISFADICVDTLSPIGGKD